MDSKPKGLFLNTSKANCSIHESGRMVFDCLKLSEKYELDYLELSAQKREIPTDYDFYAFNYHHATMGWLNTKSVRKLPGLKLTFVLETLRNNPFVLCPPDAFDVYCALDPTMNVADKRVYAFPRPLEPAPQMRPFQEPEIPVIGSFGFATQGKGFELVVDAVNQEFERAKVRINMPPGTYTKSEVADQIIDSCQRSAKDGIEISITRDFMDKDELIQWCGQNTLNCFLYNRNMPGLSATTDQAISSGRPLAISTNETFRHIHARILPYPLRSLKESIAVSELEVAQLQKDWEPHKFAARFEEVLDGFQLLERENNSVAGTVSLTKIKPVAARIKRVSMRAAKELAPPIFAKVARHLRSRAMGLPVPMKPFVHPLLRSHSQFNEDLLLDLLLGGKDSGFYVDIGANDPTINNNTKRFYDRGWTGINVEPGVIPYSDLCEARPRDINLNRGVGSSAGSLTFYDIAGDPSISSFDENVARRMAKAFHLEIVPTPILVSPLRDILAEFAPDKPIDFLSVDAEGVDYDVLKSNDWSVYRPSIAMVEMNNEVAEITCFMDANKYLLIFNNEYNGIFVDLTTNNSLLSSMIRRNYSGEIFP